MDVVEHARDSDSEDGDVEMKDISQPPKKEDASVSQPSSSESSKYE